jgi:hypothetical protein
MVANIHQQRKLCIIFQILFFYSPFGFPFVFPSFHIFFFFFFGKIVLFIFDKIRYTCLDVGLRLLHPFMPFLTEELYQRLPRRAVCAIPSIMVAPFPTFSEFSAWANLQVENEMKHAQDVAYSIRGILSSYKYVLFSSSPYLLLPSCLLFLLLLNHLPLRPIPSIMVSPFPALLEFFAWANLQVEK